ncbi:hypothetical protein PAXRUDRAFT_19715 [Paxillus rubicundulus Ve08.2h10]|uniref:Uncharacterized protein n=1 Tax=Paxillus rubicundulus Ve08.2h10 TaxID=930991 RepID=A0A0D0DBF7_9AGAM|nr:hypothetical protein PAXRUDRAFT_19715 [Paxillus rubicundulus Ve08.2h10]
MEMEMDVSLWGLVVKLAQKALLVWVFPFTTNISWPHRWSASLLRLPWEGRGVHQDRGYISEE